MNDINSINIFKEKYLNNNNNNDIKTDIEISK